MHNTLRGERRLFIQSMEPVYQPVFYSRVMSEICGQVRRDCDVYAGSNVL